MNTNTEEFRKILTWAWIVLIILALFLAATTLGVLKNLRGPGLNYNSISVTGEGEAISMPDVASFSFTVSADGKVVGDVQGQVTQKMDAILAGLKDLGIEDRDVKTTDYSVYPKYTYAREICTATYCEPSRQIPDGYTANHSVSVKVRKTEDAGKALALAGENGATGLSNISFTVDDPRQIEDEARALAITDAKERAEVIAEELGVKLVRVISYYDNGNGPMPYYGEGMGGDMVLKQSVASAPTLPTGENKVVANITITYEIR